MKIKVCGMREAKNIAELIQLKPDYIGFIFYPKSKRFVGEEYQIPNVEFSNIAKVGVFVNASLDFIIEQISQYQLALVQLHGNESPQFCQDLKKKIEIPISKAFQIDENFDFQTLETYKLVCDYFLFDTKSAHYGGTGKTFDWQILKQYDNTKPLFMSGGLSLENIGELLNFIQSHNLNVHAIDVNSKFELEPGLKDIPQIEKLFSQLNKATF